MEGGDEEIGPKRRQTRRLGPRSVYFSFNSYFLILTVYLGCNLHNTRREKEWKAAMRKSGPNDARRVVWALGQFIFIFIHIF